MNEPRWLRHASRVFSHLLCAYPERFRDRYRRELVRLFHERCQRAAAERGTLAAYWTCLRSLLNVVVTGVGERASTWRDSRRRSRLGKGREGMLNRLAQNLGYVWRISRRQPGFAVVLITTIGLGTGAAISLFSIVDAALVRPLPYPEADRVVSLLQRDPRFGLVPFASPYLRDLRERTTSYSQIAGFSPTWELTLTGAGEARVVPAAFVSDHVLAITGIRVDQGRDFIADEHRPGAAPAALVTRGFWDRTFGTGVALSAQQIRLDGKPVTVVGILAEPARLPVTTSAVSRNGAPSQIWLPLAQNPLAQLRTIPILNVMARLKPGKTRAEAEAELRAVGLTLQRDYPKTSQHADLTVIGTAELVSRAARRIVMVLFGGAVCLLLIACVNAAHLLLARASARHNEMAVRASLGASRLRIVEQLLTESLFFAGAGSVTGLLLAWWLLTAVPALGIGDLPPTVEAGIDKRVGAFAVFLAFATAVLFGLAPAWLSSKGGAANALRDGTRTIAGYRRGRGALVVIETALALTLLIGAGLLVRSLWRLTSVSPGFRTEGVIGIPIGLPEGRYAGPAARRTFFEEALRRIAHIDGVQRVSAVNRAPLAGSNVFVGVEIEGGPAAAEPPAMDRRVSLPGYFNLMAIPIVRGRDFGPADRSDSSQRVAIVNEMAVRRHWPDGNPLGRRVRLMLRGGPGPWLEIVGVVGDVRHHELDRPPEPEIYVPYAQAPVESMVVLLQTNIEPASILPAAKTALRALDADVPLDGAGQLSELLFKATAQPRFRAAVLSGFAALALVLASVGMYGVVSYSVARRVRDIGIRVALGARSGDILGMILREWLALLAIGLGAGVATSLALSRILAGMLFGVGATDPATFAAACAVLACVAAIAAYIPARRAARLDPVAALRLE